MRKVPLALYTEEIEEKNQGSGQVDGELDFDTRLVCSEDWLERMLLFATARNNGTRRAPMTQEQASCWVLRRREKICASPALLTLQGSRGKD
ncbi:putative HTH-type transcriptional regulator YeiE [Dissostichus eleginoides]|uniref:HTH-type transcriptional regulator YeiE n=1 Tax=Dissostichus eleginoides TaxID=100907 RepID=A0AAD9BHH2_DISEL|nr:putative HTH-type transcriptional regulator YeiE [Dissostichus eleginoides]